MAPTVTSSLALDTGASATDRITANATLAGTAEAGRTVIVSNGATVLGTTTAGAGGTWNFSPIGLADGSYTLTAAETDLAGNTGSTTLAFTLDTAVPTVTAALASDTGSSATDRITRSAALTGTAEAGRTVTVSNGATVLGTTTANASGVWSFAPTGLADGNYNLTATETDVAGNTGSTTLAFTLDTTAPTVTAALGFDTCGSAIDRITANASLTGTAEANRTVTVSNGATVLGTATAGAGGAWSFSPAGLADGSYTLTASETDLAGNTGSTTLAFTLDTTAPTITAALALDTGSSSTDLITGSAALTGTAEAGRTVTVSNGATVLGTTTADVGGAWSFTPVGLTDGSYTLTASETDVAGNTGSATLSFTLDTTAPAAPGGPDLAAISDSGVSNTDNITNVTIPTFTGTAEPNATVSLFDGATVVGVGQADAAGNWSMTTSALGAGVHVIAAKATDLAGNVSVASAPLSVTIDVTAPVAPSTPDLAAASDSGASNADNNTNVTTPTFTGTAEANATVTLFDGATAVGTGQANGLGTWSVATKTLADGVHAITAVATDLAGNAGAASAALSVAIDTVAPAAPGVTQVSAAAISGIAEVSSSLALFDGPTQIGTASTSGTGAWSIPIALAAGTHALTGTATDLAGNVSASSAALTAVIGTAGNDVLSGGLGAVIMLGGAGNDTYIVDNSTYVVTENVGEGVDKVVASTSYNLAAGSEIETLTGSGAAALTLAPNTITGSSGNDTLSGGGGNDTFAATIGDGNDGYDGGIGIDTYDLSQTSAAATVSLAAGTASSLQTGNDTLAAIENVIGGSGNDSITGDASNNNLTGGAGNDKLDGGAGADTMTGGTGNDTYTVDNAADLVTEAVGQGTDTVNASVSYSLATGQEVENLTASVATGLSLTGNEFNNTITGGAGNDTLSGGLGNDRFVATVGDGSDAYDGGLGTDTYDLSGTTAGATVNLGLGTSTSATTGTDLLTAIENVIGSLGNDTFVAAVGDGNNSYNGGLGTDTYDLSATSAAATVNLNLATAQTISLDVGTDILTVNTIENVTGSTGNDTITGNAADNVLAGGAGNDLLDGRSGNDTLRGGAGNDTLNGGVGADTTLGGIGNDTYFVDNALDVVTEAVGEGTADLVWASVNYTLAVGSEVENLRAAGATGLTLTGNEFANSLLGFTGDDTLFGGAGNDTLNGGVGADTMAGGTGNDTYFVDNTGDAVIEVVGEGTDLVWATGNYTLAAGSAVETLRVSGTTGLTLTGNELSHLIVGGAGADTLNGGVGNDTLQGGIGNDTLNGGAGNDTLDGGVGADTMAGGTGNDIYFVENASDIVTEAVGEGTDLIWASVNYTLAAGSEVESRKVSGSAGLTLTGNEFSHAIVGGAGNDTLNGGIGNDTLTGGVGADTMTGGAGNDTYFVENSADVVTENTGQGSDTIWASSNYALGAASEIEFLKANAGTGLTLTGNGLNNTIIGGAGNDILDGGTGNDVLLGGLGTDVFKFLANFGNDTISDFDSNPVGGQDLMDISGLGVTAATFSASVQIAAFGAGAKVTFGTNSINLLGVAPASIDQTDFRLAL